MALRLAFVLLFSIAAFGLGNAVPAFPTQKCVANAEFRTCASACEPTCANPKPGPICTLQCVIGCFCNEGFLMNSAGVCVRPTECDAATPTVQPITIPLHHDRRPVRCAVNEEFRQCKGCDSTCFSSEIPCPRICIPGCACKQGHVRMNEDGKGQCIPMNQCPIIDPPVVIEVHAAVDPVDGKCATNELFYPCGSACAPTCQNPHPSPVCTKNCVIGCFCQEGFLRNHFGVCVPTRECLVSEAPIAAAMPVVPQCPADEFFNPCGSACAPTCKDPNPSPVCTKNCVPACFCREGLLRNEKGECVQHHLCNNDAAVAALAAPLPPPLCGENEVMAACHLCDASCENPTPLCKRILSLRMCRPGCACKENHVRNADGQCIPQTQCPQTASVSEVHAAVKPVDGKCAANEAFQACGSACAPTCQNPHPSPVCTKNCVIGCFCQEGFLRNHVGVCVPTRECLATEAPVASFIALPPDHEKCGVNEEFSTCGSFCAPTCAVRQPRHCTLRCKVGCFCKKGFFKNAQGVCVPETECEQQSTSAPIVASAPINKCPTENEIYHECGVQLNCLSSCTFKHTPECMQRMCTAGCLCKKPFVRHDDGRCVEVKECPNKPSFLLGADGH